MPSRRPSAVSYLVLLVLLVAVARWAGQRPGAAEETEPEAPCAPADAACAAGEGPDGLAGVPTRPPSAFPVLTAEDVCPGAGYLCTGLATRGVWQVMRWDEGTPVIRVRVPTPPEEDRVLARALQQAAARGLRAWDGHPIPLRVDMTDRSGPADFVVTWVRHPTGSELGKASTRWRFSGDRGQLEVTEFTLSFRMPFGGGRALDPRQVQLTAAHEMGHALGLPHSDEPTDIMYPTNTALRLSVRDYRTMEALYALPNGAKITPPDS